MVLKDDETATNENHDMPTDDEISSNGTPLDDADVDECCICLESLEDSSMETYKCKGCKRLLHMRYIRSFSLNPALTIPSAVVKMNGCRHGSKITLTVHLIARTAGQTGRLERMRL